MNQEIVKLIPFVHSPHVCNDVLSDNQRFLVTLLRRALQKTGNSSLASAAKKEIQDPEGLFYKIVLNDFNRRDARLFAAHLLMERDFFQRIRPLVDMIVHAQNVQEEPCCSMLPDEAILSRMAVCRTRKKRVTLAPLHRLVSFLRGSSFSPRWAAAAAVGIIVIISAHGLLKTNALYKEFFIHPAEPFSSLSPETYAFHSTLRKSLTEMLPNWRENYRMAVAAYLDKDYEKAVELFSKVEPISQSDTSLSEAWRREFFFHYGLAVLGKSGGKSLHRKNYAEAARLFEKALTCCPPQEDADAVRFFLGLSLFLQGEKDAAAVYLQEISPASSFYHQAQRMISP